jgi:hypothetical protein
MYETVCIFIRLLMYEPVCIFIRFLLFLMYKEVTGGVVIETGV